MINELSFNEQFVYVYSVYSCDFQPDNIILAVLWFASQKPQMSAYLQPVTEMLLSLETASR